MPSESTLARMAANKKRIKRLGLRMMCFHVPDKLYKAFKVKVARDRVTVGQVAAAMIELYSRGGFTVEKEADKTEKK